RAVTWSGITVCACTTGLSRTIARTGRLRLWTAPPHSLGEPDMQTGGALQRNKSHAGVTLWCACKAMLYADCRAPLWRIGWKLRERSWTAPTTLPRLVLIRVVPPH